VMVIDLHVSKNFLNTNCFVVLFMIMDELEHVFVF
jgi:hypothetical protein